MLRNELGLASEEWWKGWFYLLKYFLYFILFVAISLFPISNGGCLL